MANIALGITFNPGGHISQLFSAGFRPKEAEFAGFTIRRFHHQLRQVIQRELDLADPLVALFVVENQELLIPREDGFTPVALDYSHETVRAHRLAIMRDVIVDHGERTTNASAPLLSPSAMGWRGQVLTASR